MQRRHGVSRPAISLLGESLDLGAVRRDEGEFTRNVEGVDEDQSEDGTDAEKGLDDGRLGRSSARERGPG